MNGAAQIHLYFRAGTDANGNPKYKVKVFKNVKGTATSESILAFANAIAELGHYTLERVERSDYTLVSAEQ